MMKPSLITDKVLTLGFPLEHSYCRSTDSDSPLPPGTVFVNTNLMGSKFPDENPETGASFNSQNQYTIMGSFINSTGVLVYNNQTGNQEQFFSATGYRQESDGLFKNRVYDRSVWIRAKSDWQGKARGFGPYLLWDITSYNSKKSGYYVRCISMQ